MSAYDVAGSCPQAQQNPWPLQRILFLLAGTVTLTGVILGALVNQWFLVLSALAGVNQLLMVGVGWCPMSVILSRLGVGRPCVETAGGPKLP
jgi:hypothetical protein